MNNTAIATVLSGIIEEIRKLALTAVWSTDEFGLSYRQPSSWSISQNRVASNKKEKYCPKLLACCNADGREKLIFLIKGNVERPRVFFKKCMVMR